MTLRYANDFDKILLLLGICSSLVFGAALPAFCLLFGALIDSVGQNSFDMLGMQAKWMIIIGLIVWVVSWFMISLLSVFAESIQHKIKIDYFRKCLEKNSAWFDENSPTELASKISKETAAIQRGSGEKVGNLIMSISSFFFGFIFAFYWGWLMTLILLGLMPLMLLTGVGMAAAMGSGVKETMKAYA